jgi:hypothetical protein
MIDRLDLGDLPRELRIDSGFDSGLGRATASRQYAKAKNGERALHLPAGG